MVAGSDRCTMQCDACREVLADCNQARPQHARVPQGRALRFAVRRNLKYAIALRHKVSKEGMLMHLYADAPLIEQPCLKHAGSSTCCMQCYMATTTRQSSCCLLPTHHGNTHTKKQRHFAAAGDGNPQRPPPTREYLEAMDKKRECSCPPCHTCGSGSAPPISLSLAAESCNPFCQSPTMRNPQCKQSAARPCMQPTTSHHPVRICVCLTAPCMKQAL